MNDWQHSCFRCSLPKWRKDLIKLKLQTHGKRDFCIAAYEHKMQVNSISKELARLYDHMAFFLMYIWDAEKTPASAT